MKVGMALGCVKSWKADVANGSREEKNLRGRQESEHGGLSKPKRSKDFILH